jgi:hypothetical protein
MDNDAMGMDTFIEREKDADGCKSIALPLA